MYLNEEQATDLHNWLRLLSTSTMNDEEFTRFIEFKRQLNELVNPKTAALQPAARDSVLNETLNSPVAITVDEWGNHQNNHHDPYSHSSCSACIQIIKERS